MIKISRIDAHQGMDEIDFKVMDQELAQQFSVAKTTGADMTYEFFLDDLGQYIVMKVYFDGKEVELYRFINKGTLTEQGEKAVGRPSIGVTKKVSITLPEEVWEELDQIQKASGCRSRSEMFRTMAFNILGKGD